MSNLLDEIDRYRTLAAKTRDAAIQAAERKYNDRLRELDQLAREAESLMEKIHSLDLDSADGDTADGAPPEQPGPVPVKPSPRPSPTALLREAIRAAGDEFTVPQLADWIDARYPHQKIPRPYFSSAMHKIRQAGQVEVVRSPGGREPVVYRRAEPNGRLMLAATGEQA